MKPQSAKAKGRNLQKLVVRKILETFSLLTANDVRSTSMGNQGVDVQLSTKALFDFPFAVECKNVERIKILYDMYEQSLTNSKNKLFGVPIVVAKSNKKEPLVMISLDDFMDMARVYSRRYDV